MQLKNLINIKNVFSQSKLTKKYTETLEIRFGTTPVGKLRALVGWARASGSCPAQVHSLCFSITQSDPQTRGTNGTACFNPPGVRNGDSPALSVSPGAHSSRKATMNILNPFKASARRSHRVYPRCVSDREMLWMRQRSESQPTGESTLYTTCDKTITERWVMCGSCWVKWTFDVKPFLFITHI